MSMQKCRLLSIVIILKVKCNFKKSMHTSLNLNSKGKYDRLEFENVTVHPRDQHTSPQIANEEIHYFFST